MNWKKDGGESKSWTHETGDGGDDADIKGVELNVVCKGVPVLTLDKSSIFHENVSWMLQSALASSGKADSLYEYCEDEAIFAECRRLGLRDDDLSLVRLKQHDLKHVKAVGTSGKRSVMLAVVVALALDNGDALVELWKELRAYKLDKPFVGLLKSGQHTVSKEVGTANSSQQPTPTHNSEKPPPVEFVTAEGVELSVVSGRVPVIGLEKTSIFQENVSWLLQTATSSSGKADALYEYSNEREILKECRRLGLSDQEVGLVRMKREDLLHVKAVGTSGKRSIMLSLVVALVLHDEVKLDAMLKEVWEYDKNLERPFVGLVNSAERLAGKEMSQTSWNGKRKWAGAQDNGWSDTDWGWDQQSLGMHAKRRGGRQWREEPDEESLDKQLEDYWGDDR